MQGWSLERFVSFLPRSMCQPHNHIIINHSERLVVRALNFGKDKDSSLIAGRESISYPPIPFAVAVSYTLNTINHYN